MRSFLSVYFFSSRMMLPSINNVIRVAILLLLSPSTMARRLNCTEKILRHPDLLRYSGIRLGTLHQTGTDLGDFENCIALDDAHHCTFSLTLRPPSTTPLGPPGNRNLGMPLAMLGLCAPKECSAQDIHDGIEMLPAAHELPNIPGMNTSVMDVSCAEDVVTIGNDPVACVMVAVTLILCVVVCVGTSIDTPDKAHHQHCNMVPSGVTMPERGTEASGSTELGPTLTRKRVSWHELLVAFSLSKNFRALFHHKQNKTNYLNGIRYLSILWIIFGHLFVFTKPGFRNLLAALPVFVDNYFFVVVSTSTFCVDTFFFMGGFLQAYILTKRIHKLKKKCLHGIPYLYLLRYFRLTPLLAYALFAARIFKFAGHGAIWFHFQRSTIWATAEKYWWAVLLYVNDYVPYKDGYSAGAFEWTWYLANDFQFFLVTPPLILLYIYVSKRGTVGLILFMMGCSAVLNYRVRTFLQQDSYMRPTNRCPPYFWGVLAGLLLLHLDEHCPQERERRSSRPHEGESSQDGMEVRNASSWDTIRPGDRPPPTVSMEAGSGDADSDRLVDGPSTQVKAGWEKRVLRIIHGSWPRKGLYFTGFALLASGSWLQSQRVLAHYASMYRPDLGIRQWSTLVQSWHAAYYVLCWGLGLAFITIPWCFGYGGYLRKGLEHRMWSPLARLTYGVYLAHPFVNLYWTYQASTWFILTVPNLILMWISFALLSTGLSLFAWLLVEKPVANILDMIVQSR